MRRQLDALDQVGPYRIVRRLGQGGMGTVYEALDTRLGRLVALKVITPALADDPAFRTRFVREARAQASLDSPHVVQVFAHGEVDGRLYLASQLVPDGDLAALLRRQGPLPPTRAADLVAQVADGLAEAHRAGLVHRDIKASNVLLRHRGPDTVAYLADFGVVADLDEACLAADIAALGRLLWSALTGQELVGSTPVPGGSGRFGSEVDLVLRRALAQDPAERHPTAEALRDDLRSLAGTTSAACRREPLRHLRILTGVAVVLGLGWLVVGVGAATGPSGGRLDGATEQQVATDALARALASGGDLDPAGAQCAARRLVGTHGVADLRERGLLDADLAMVGHPDGTRAPEVLADVLAATAACLWEP